LYELALIILGQLLGLALALCIYLLSRYHKHLDKLALVQELLAPTGEELKQNIRKADQLLECLQSGTKELVSMPLPYPAFRSPLVGHLTDSASFDSLPSEARMRLSKCRTDMAMFNELYYRLYYLLICGQPDYEIKRWSSWVDESSEIEAKVRELELRRISAIRKELLAFCGAIRSLLKETADMVSGYRPPRPRFLSFIANSVLGRK
jgi:hypothetical protein